MASLGITKFKIQTTATLILSDKKETESYHTTGTNSNAELAKSSSSTLLSIRSETLSNTAKTAYAEGHLRC